MELQEYALMADVEDRHWWWRARREILRNVIAAYLPKPEGRGLRLLEVGCGTGGNLAMLAEFGDVLGAEHEPTALAHLRGKHGDRFEAIQHSIPAPIPGAFDVIGMFDVLEHLSDDAAAVRWLTAHLQPGGIAVVTVPAFPFLWSEHDVAAHHHRRYTLTGLTALAPSESEVLYAGYFNSLLFPAVAAIRMAMRALPVSWRPAGTQMGLPPSLPNWLAYQVFRTEKHLIPRCRPKAGVSALLVLRRPLYST